jgi:alpha/beta superfamily hydrolase
VIVMNEETVFFGSGELSIEGLYAPVKGTKGVVITHPHSQMGGSMRNNVVEAMVSAFYEHGYSTLRFNFRGVGQSKGTFDDGVGEQEDVKGAIAFLKEKGFDDITLAGYSFGAWVNSRVLAGFDDLTDVVMVSPPIDFVKFDFSHLTGRCGLVICGDRDQFCPIPSLEGIIQELESRLEIVNGADHFYFGREQGIIDYLSDYLGDQN